MCDRYVGISPITNEVTLKTAGGVLFWICDNDRRRLSPYFTAEREANIWLYQREWFNEETIYSGKAIYT